MALTGVVAVRGDSLFFHAKSIGFSCRKSDAGIAQTADKIIIRALLFEDVFLLSLSGWRSLRAPHLIENIGATLVRADEERRLR